MQGRKDTEDYILWIITRLLRDVYNFGATAQNGAIVLNLTSMNDFNKRREIQEFLMNFKDLALAMPPDNNFRLLRLRLYRGIMNIIKKDL